ncbi:hypothetical protein [Candidatus Nitrososphaera evergladensis]|nr:hypothetical protein [Candidatus Nitrososphaera evergladensis]
MLRATIKMLKNTHRHPANKALHAVGLPIYAYGIAMIIGSFAGAGTDNALLGLGLWALAVSMLVAGHAIEGNVMSMTPVLLARLVFRSLCRVHLVEKRVHLLR